MVYFLPQLDKLERGTAANLGNLNVSVAKFWKNNAGNGRTCPSLRIEVIGTQEVEEQSKEPTNRLFRQRLDKALEAYRVLGPGGKIAIKMSAQFKLADKARARDLVKAYDDFCLQPRWPSTGVNFPILEVLNLRTCFLAEKAVKKLKQEDQTLEQKKIFLAAALAKGLHEDLRTYTSVESLAQALREMGEVKFNSSRKELQE
jgi:hypothetical protein